MKQAGRYICIVLLAALLPMLAGCGGRDEGRSLYTVRACVCAPIGTLDPALDDGTAGAVFYALYENLMRAGRDGEGRLTVEPAAARAYETVENFDGTRDYIFTLRSSARWSDGTRLKARDFVYAWRRLADPATESPNAALLSMVRGYDAARETGDAAQLAVYADNDTTFRVTLAEPCPYFLSDVCTAVATMPLRSSAVEKGDDWALSAAMPCNGPFRISAWTKQESLYLRRNDSYHDNRAVTVDALRFLFTGDAEQAALYFDSGAADYVADPKPDTEGAAALPLRETVYVVYNHMSDVFSNPHARRAFDLSLDRAAIAAAAGEAAVPATGLVAYGVTNVSEEGGDDFRAAGGALLPVDAEHYASRCAEAGNELRLGGYWGGVELPALACLYVAEDGTFPATVTAVEQWRDKLGASITIEGLSRDEFDERVASGVYDLAIDTLRVDCGGAMEFLAPFAGLDADNAPHYVSKPYDLLIGVAGASGDADARAAMLHDAEALLLSDTAVSPLYFGGRTYLAREGLSGVTHDMRGNACFAYAAEQTAAAP